MDKPKQRGTNKPKSFSRDRTEKQAATETGARTRAAASRHTGGAKPRPPRGR